MSEDKPEFQAREPGYFGLGESEVEALRKLEAALNRKAALPSPRRAGWEFAATRRTRWWAWLVFVSILLLALIFGAWPVLVWILLIGAALWVASWFMD